MPNIGDASVVSESGDQAVVARELHLQRHARRRRHRSAAATAQREFTLTKGGSGWGVSSMTGQAP